MSNDGEMSESSVGVVVSAGAVVSVGAVVSPESGVSGPQQEVNKIAAVRNKSVIFLM
jgi:hypothetical protein